MKKVCITGYGAIGPIHGMALEHVKQARLYAVCDIDPGRRKRCREQYGVAEYEDFDAMLQDPAIDSVHICTPHWLHYEMIRKALAAGKDVVAEKPVTRTRQEWNELKALEGSRRVCVVLQNRLNPCIRKLKELIQEGTLGPAKSVRAILTWSRDQAYYESGDWRGRWATEGGGLLINQAIHTLDFISYLLGDIRKVRTDMCNHTLEGIIEVEDTLSAHLELESGVKGVFFATNGYPENASPFLEISFQKGMVRYMDQKLWVNGCLAAEDAAPKAGKDYWGRGHEWLLQRYYDQGAYFTLSDVENTMETMFSMYEDAVQRKPFRKTD